MLEGLIGEAPNIAESDSEADGRQDEVKPSAPVAAFVFIFVIFDSLLKTK